MSLNKKLSNLKANHPGLFPEWAKEFYLKSRQLMAERRALPHFIVIGAQKSGSTTLFNYIAVHPQVLPSIQKEIFFFNRNFTKGVLWYRRYFPFDSVLASKGMITGEASTTYLSSKQAPERAKTLLPNSKIIAVLRDPVERAISQYHHSFRTGREIREIENVFTEDLFTKWEEGEELPSLDYSYLDNGYYAPQILRWLRHYPEKQLMVIQADMLFSEAVDITSRVYEFLELKEYWLDKPSVFNKGTYNTNKHGEIIIRLKNFYNEKNTELLNIPSVGFTWAYDD